MSVIDVISGNKSAAYGVKLSRVQVIPVYPITPQTTMAEYLADFVANGKLNAEYIPVESEHSAMMTAWGSELVGARTFTSTSSQGLAYMHEAVAGVPADRLPIVMGIANRTLGGLWSLKPDYSDVMPEKDLGWLQFFVESNQEILDTIIQTYRIAEDKKVLLPAMVNFDGYYLSYSYEPVEIPDQEAVDDFLPPYKAEHVNLDPTIRFQSTLGGVGARFHTTFVRFQEEAMDRSRKIILEIDEEFGKKFGRRYGGLIEKYKCKDADAVLVTMGSMTTSARRIIDKLRKEGERIGLVKLRTYRPFPIQEFQEIARDVKAIGVVDRAFLFGVKRGMAFTDVISSIYQVEEKPLLTNFIAGLGGRDVNKEDLEYVAKKVLKTARTGKIEKELEYLEDLEAVKRFSPPPKPLTVEGGLLQPGSNACKGCSIPLLMRRMLKVLGKNTILIRAPCCAGLQQIVPFATIVGVPAARTCFPGAGAMLTGVRRALTIQNRPYVNVVSFIGDGGTVDIGLQSLSGAAERGESVIYLCYDNEAYMNTGIQRSATTPLGAWTTTTPVGEILRGKNQEPKDMIRIMAAHRIPYIATASVAYLRDFSRKVEEASEICREGKGLAYIHAQQPCPTGWRFAASKTIEVARLAVQTGVWPLIQVKEGNLKINHKPSELKPVSEYLKLQGRFRHFTKDEIDGFQETVNRKWKALLEMEKTGIFACMY